MKRDLVNDRNVVHRMKPYTKNNVITKVGARTSLGRFSLTQPVERPAAAPCSTAIAIVPSPTEWGADLGPAPRFVLLRVGDGLLQLLRSVGRAHVAVEEL